MLCIAVATNRNNILIAHCVSLHLNACSTMLYCLYTKPTMLYSAVVARHATKIRFNMSTFLHTSSKRMTCASVSTFLSTFHVKVSFPLVAVFRCPQRRRCEINSIEPMGIQCAEHRSDNFFEKRKGCY